MTKDSTIALDRHAAQAGGPPGTSEYRSRASAALLLFVVVAAFAASRLSIAGVPSEREYDEGVYLCSARAVAAGHALFTDVFSSQPPAIVETLAMALRAFGDNLFVARTFSLVFALVALLAVASIARRIGGVWAAPVAAAALALSMTFTDVAHVVVAETPALGLALASIAVCLASRDRGWSRPLLASSGTLFGLSALFKLIVVPLAAPFGLLLLLAPRDARSKAGRDARKSISVAPRESRGAPKCDPWHIDRRPSRVIARCATVAIAALVVLALPFAIYDPADIYEQVLRFHFSKHDTYDLDPRTNLARAMIHMRADAAVALVAAAGVVLMAFRARMLAAAWLVAWTATMLAVLAVQTPIFWRHFVLLSPPVAIAAGAGVALAAAGSRRRSGAFALAVIALWTAVALQRDRGLFPHLSDGLKHDRADAALVRGAEWIEKNSLQEDLVASDDQMAVFVAGRHSPPELCDTSWARVYSRSLEVEQAARASLPARIVMLRTGSRLSGLPGYTDWLKKNYEQRPPALTGLGAHRSIWIRKPGATADPSTAPATAAGTRAEATATRGPAGPRAANRLEPPATAAPAR